MRRLYRLVFIFIIFLHLDVQSYNIDIITNFNLDELCPDELFSNEYEAKIRVFNLGFANYRKNYHNSNIDKILLMGPIAYPQILLGLPVNQLVLFLWEPENVNDTYCGLFSRVYTYNDDLVDEWLYFKFFYPVRTPMISNIWSFSEKNYVSWWPKKTLQKELI